MQICLDTFCSPECFLRTLPADDEVWPAATVKVLLIANGCLRPHLIVAKTDGYLDLSSVWNINVDRWLGDRFVQQSDYSEHSFGVRGGVGMTLLRYKYTTHFLEQDSVQVPNELFTSLCCKGIGTWYGNVVVCAHVPDTGERLSISWDPNN